ncbi:MAG: hypothetical protein JWN55_2837 [Frankiales bacterium]|jgi:hypothetical protein|nr:hypothetical protein [Frankiales bacterium]
MSGVTDQTTVIRPSAVLKDTDARRVLTELEAQDVSRGGVWSASPGVWQRYDKPWDGPGGMKGSSQLIGTIGAVYGTPSKYDITIYRVTVTSHGDATGWNVERICDDALQYAGLTLASCPRTTLSSATPDPFRKS